MEISVEMRGDRSGESVGIRQSNLAFCWIEAGGRVACGHGVPWRLRGRRQQRYRTNPSPDADRAPGRRGQRPDLSRAGHGVSGADGSWNESPNGYDVLIYDGQTLTPDQIDTLPSTDNFLSAGKSLIVLAPTQDDRQALDDHLGATALDDSPAVAAFKAYSSDQLLQTVDMVEFPVTLNEDAVQTVPPGPVSRSDSSALARPRRTMRLWRRKPVSGGRITRVVIPRPASVRCALRRFTRSVRRGRRR